VAPTELLAVPGVVRHADGERLGIGVVLAVNEAK
jgi:hypothetical protein